MKSLFFLFILGNLSLISCATKIEDKRLDTSSTHHFEKSYDEVLDSLPDNNKEKFQLAVASIFFSQLDLSKALNGSVLELEKNLKSGAFKLLHNKTGPQVIEHASKNELKTSNLMGLFSNFLGKLTQLQNSEFLQKFMKAPLGKKSR